MKHNISTKSLSDRADSSRGPILPMSIIADNRVSRVIMAAGRLHVAHPQFAGRGICGRRVPNHHLVTADVYRHTPRAQRCRKCAMRIVFFERIEKHAAAALAAPGRQREFWE